MTFMKSLMSATAALALTAGAALAEPAIIFDLGGKFDKSFNEAAFLEVAAGNVAAIGLYRAQGFAEAGRRRGYFRHADGWAEDAIVMRRALRNTANGLPT